MSEVHARELLIFIQGSDIGYSKDYDLGTKNAAIKDYKTGSTDPSTLEYGNFTYTISINKGYVSATFMSLQLAKTKVSVEVRDSGTGAGLPKLTYANCIITDWGKAAKQNAVIRENIKLEAPTAPAPGTQ